MVFYVIMGMGTAFVTLHGAFYSGSNNSSPLESGDFTHPRIIN
jgi:hypothetical protein